MQGEKVGVLLAAGGAPWEVPAIAVVAAAPTRAVLLRRCVDLPDLLAAATTGQARVAVVSDGLPGLDADSVSRLREHGVAVVVVSGVDGPTSGGRLPGVFDAIADSEVERLGALIGLAAAEAARAENGRSPAAPAEVPGPARVNAVVPASCGDRDGTDATDATGDGSVGRVVAVWGPAGAPGRTTVAVNLAAELARRGHDTLLVDADAYGAAVAQHLGVLDEASGLLGAVRLANAGRLDVAELASVAREVAPGLRVLTGLPRPDRWVEVRAAAFDMLVETARRLSRHVVLDLGFDLAQETASYGLGTPQRRQMTVAGLDHADDVVVVGSADPVGLARLARGLVEVPELVPASMTHVVVNRVRPTLGWGEQEVRAMIAGFVTPAGTYLLPDHPASVDRALVAGRPLLDSGESPLVRSLAVLADALDGSGAGAAGRRPRRGRLRRRRAGRGR